MEMADILVDPDPGLCPNVMDKFGENLPITI